MEGPIHAADDLLDFFPSAGRDGLNITWAHAINSKEALEQAIKGDCMMLETDIIVRGLGTQDQTSIPVNAHPPNTDSDITFEEWIDQVLQYPNKGIKLDFKCQEAVEPTLQIINDRRRKMRVPVLLNADIAVGPNSLEVVIDANTFLTTCNTNFDMVTMSLGFTTGYDYSTKDTYTWEMIFDILEKVHNLGQPVTFPVRAVYLSTCWQRFVWLLGLKQSYSLTVWSHASDWVDMAGLLALRKHAGKERVFFDLSEEQLTEFQTALSIENIWVPIKSTSLWNIDLWYIDPVGSPSGNFVFLGIEGVGFLAKNNNNPVSQRVWSKQVLDVNDTQINPFKVTGKVRFIDTKDHTSEETQLKVHVTSSCNYSSCGSCSSNTVDLLAFCIKSSGTICLQNLSSHISADASLTLPSAKMYEFALCKVGVGHTPVLNVTSESSAGELPESISMVCTENVAVGSACHSLSVSFGKVGTSKHLLVEEFNVKF